MKKLIAFFVDRSLAVNLITIAILVLGVLQLTEIPRALLPNQKPNTVQVTAELPGASAIDMERIVTFRLEEAISGMDSIEELTSTTTNSRSVLRVKMEPEVDDLGKPMEEIRSRISSVRHRLPDDLRPVQIDEARADTGMLMTIYIKGVDPKEPDDREAVKTIAEHIRRIPDVVDAKPKLDDMNLYIRFDRTALDEYGLSVTLARQRIMQFLEHMPVGAVRVKDEDVAVEIGSGLEDLDALRGLPLQVNRRGEGVRLNDVATVEYGFQEPLSIAKLNGATNYVTLDIRNGENADTISLSEEVREKLDEWGPKTLPEGAEIVIASDGSELIEHEQETLVVNGLAGIGIVLLVLMLFLGWRVSAMTALGLPIAYMGVVLVLPLFGVNFNILSLVAMILVLGILVDDAIIVAEEFCQQVQAGLSTRDAAVEAVMKVGKPVIGMVLTTTIAFLPLVFIKSGMSWIIRPIPIVIIAALFLSLFESFLILPNHLHHLMPEDRGMKERRFVAALRVVYQRLLAVFLKARYLALIILVGLVAGAGWLVTGPLETTTSLTLAPSTTIHVELEEPAPSLDALAAKVAPVEEKIEALPDEWVQHYRTVLGKKQKGAIGWKYAHIEVTPPGTFVEQETRRHKLADKLEPELEKLAQTDGFKRLSLRQESGSGKEDVVTVYVSGGDRIAFEEVQNEIRDALTEIESIQRVEMDESRFQRAWTFQVDDEKVLAYEMTRQGLFAQVREHFSRKELVRLRTRGEELSVFLDFQEEAEPTAEELSALTVINGRGVPVPLSYLGEWREIEVLRHIEHKDLLRMFKIDVLYDPDETDGEEVKQLVEENLDPVREQYPSYRVSVEANEAESKTKAWLIRIAAMCILLIYICLALSLNSMVQPIVILFAIPFGFIGVVLAFYSHGMELGIMAAIGILGLAGVVVNDSLVMTSTINDVFRADPDKGMRKAVADGAASRFRAVILTSLTTLGGVFPLAYGIGGEAGWLQPMVFALGWGLLFATILTLFFIPCILLILDDVRRVGLWLWRLPRRLRDGGDGGDGEKT